MRLKDAALQRKAKEFKTVSEKAVEERDRALNQKKAQKAKFVEKFGEIKEKYKSSREKVRELKREKAALEAEKATFDS